MKYILTFFQLFLVLPLIGQQIPTNRKTDWSNPGSCLTIRDTTVYLRDFGGDSTGSTDNSLAFSLAQAALGSQGGTIQFGEGDYFFSSSVTLASGIRVKGKGVNNTQFIHNLSGSGHLFRINGTISSTKDTLIGGYSFGSDSVLVTNSSLYLPGNLLKLVENDGGRIYSSWANNSIGQIVKIVKISGNWLYLDKPLRQKYTGSLFPRISKISPISEVSFECFALKRMDATTSQSKNFDLNYAANCEFRGIRSDSCNFSHISISNSTNISVTHCYFKNAHDYGGGGKGYGVVLQSTSGNCLIENNQFEHLRHSVLLQSSSNGNVISYNYSLDPYWTGVFLPSNSAGDMVLHGNYPYMNLFEGNICQNIVIDNSHGINGKFNTFLRNRAQLYGVFMNTSPASDSQNFVGNEITNTLVGMKNLAGNGHYDYGNKLRGTISPPSTNANPINSLYLPTSKPLFWDPLATFPFAGNPAPYNQFHITAFSNYHKGILAPCDTDTVNYALVICPSDSVRVSGKLVLNEGIYLDSSTSSSGCKTYLKTRVSHFPKPNITVTWFLTSSQGDYYQWKLNGVTLPGDSLRTLPINQNGYYQVLVTDSNGCSQLSDSVLVNSVGIAENLEEVVCYPNPFHSTLTLQKSSGGNSVFQLLTVDGKIAKEWQYLGKRQQIDVSYLSQGIYFLTEKGSNSYLKLIKN